MKIKVSNVNAPNWRDVNVTSQIPAELENLSELAKNIWWSWNFEAIELFKSLDPALWKEVGQNPVLLLERMSYAKLEALAQDKVILKRMNDVYSKFRLYMDVEPDKNRPSVAYFSMEYGLNQILKIYSGGLGVLAGDYLKEASDSNVNLCAVGFLYRYGYFTQTLAMPYWHCVIFPNLKKADELLVVAHGNSLRGIIKHLKGISDENIVSLNLPTAVPYVFEFDDDLNFTKDYFLGDPEEIKKLMDAVANQGKKQ